MATLAPFAHSPLPRAPQEPPTLAQLLSTPVVLRPPYSRSALGQQTWDALVRDGDIVELWDGHGLPAGMPTTADLRARSLTHDIPRDVVVGRSTAAWIHTGTPRPVRLCILYAPCGYRPRNTPGLDVCQASVRPWEVHEIGGLRVTDAVRTALDVATWVPDETVMSVLLPLLQHGVEVDMCLQRLDRVANWRRATRAREVLLDAARSISPRRGAPESLSR